MEKTLRVFETDSQICDKLESKLKKAFIILLLGLVVFLLV